jgi:hypothetical protein
VTITVILPPQDALIYTPPQPLPTNEDEADIGIRDGGTPVSVGVGEEFDKVFVVSLSGEREGTSVLFVDVLPVGLAFVSASGGSCVYIAESRRVECQLGVVRQGQPVTVSVRVRATEVGRYINIGQVIGLDTRIVDLPSNNGVQQIIAVVAGGVASGQTSAVRATASTGGFVQCWAEGVCEIRWATEGVVNIVRYELVREAVPEGNSLHRSEATVMTIAPKEVNGRARYEVTDSDVKAGRRYDYTVRAVGTDGVVHTLQAQRVTVPMKVFMALLVGR